MPNLANLWKPTTAWAERHQPLLGALGHVLAFAVLFGGTALAAYQANFAGPFMSAVCGALAIYFAKFYVRRIPAAQRVIDRLHPAPDAVKSDTLPAWAVVVYALIGLALVLAVIASEETYAYAAVALFAAWTAGCYLLHYLWTRQTKPETPRALDIIDPWLDALAAPHQPRLRALGSVLCFVLLICGVALHAHETGFARAAAAYCGTACRAMPDAGTAALCGLAAILFVWLYAMLAGGVQRSVIDPWKHVRPEPAPAQPPRWAVVLHVLIGLVVFFLIAGAGDTAAQAEGMFYTTIEGGGRRVTLDGRAQLELVLGWWIGGRGVLGFFWPKPAGAAAFAKRART
jgi:hypothetical protein